VSKWQTIRLGSACEKIGSGATPRGGSEVYQTSGISLIRSQNIYNDGFKRDGLAFIGDKHAKELENVNVQSGDVLLNITGDSVARVCQVPEKILPARVNQHVAIIRPKKNVLDARFLHYFLIHPQTQAHMLGLAGAGATRNALTKGMIESFEIKAPSFSEQRAIASALGSLDDKIELNRRMNETLEALVQSLFKSWFVDATQSALPKGWCESTIGEEVRVVGGSTPSTTKPEFWEGGTHHWATPKDLSNLNSPVLLETERKITDAGIQQISSGLLPVGTVLLSSRAPIGYLVIAEVPVAINQGFIAMICDGSLPNHYVRLWTKTNMDAIEGRANGTTFMEISKGNFRSLPVIVPPKPMLDDFQKQVEPLHRRVVSNLKESRTLAALRDALLPKLLSGELRVPAAAKLVEATA
jgi:type I restriction enzyme S subunit